MTNRPPPTPVTKEEADDTALALQAIPYLNSSGWIRSRRSKTPLDGRGRPLPWYTHAAINFLATRVREDMDVFEFGSGNSTLWWAARAASVHSVEHHAAWAEHMAERVPDNVQLRHIELETDGEYCRATWPAKDAYHVVVIDGRDRVNCALRCQDALRQNGVIVWDNSERPRYQEGYDFLAQRGFRRIEFRGIGPVNKKGWETSIFYRSDNCLGI